MIASPCINVCKMDSQTGLCTGCFRSIDEIAAWSQTDDAHRREILAAVARRRLEQQFLKEEFAVTATAIDNEDPYICVGICMADPDSGYCLGCGRPPLESPDIVAEVAKAVPKMSAASSDPDNLE